MVPKNKKHKIGDLLELGLPRDTIPLALAGCRRKVDRLQADERDRQQSNGRLRMGFASAANQGMVRTASNGFVTSSASVMM
ncbi:MAG: hypothetical protein ACI8P0_003834 [Planctomycetaceae bacterium]